MQTNQRTIKSDDMVTKFTREQIMRSSNEEILEKTNGKAVDFHLIDGNWTQLCVGDLACFDSESGCFHTKTGIKIRLQDVDYIEVIG